MSALALWTTNVGIAIPIVPITQAIKYLLHPSLGSPGCSGGIATHKQASQLLNRAPHRRRAAARFGIAVDIQGSGVGLRGRNCLKCHHSPPRPFALSPSRLNTSAAVRAALNLLSDIVKSSLRPKAGKVNWEGCWCKEGREPQPKRCRVV